MSLFLRLISEPSSTIHMKMCRARPLSCIPTKVILSPTNKQINTINDTILLRFNASTKVCYSVDTVYGREEVVHYSITFLNYWTSLRNPQHKLIQKISFLIKLLWNLCLNLWLQIQSLKICLLECMILISCGLGGNCVDSSNTNDTNHSTIPVYTASISRKIVLFNDRK